MDNPANPDDRDIAKYVFSAGADWWYSMTAGYAGYNGNNTEHGYGRFKWITNSWRPFNFTNMTQAQLLASPPPLD